MTNRFSSAFDRYACIGDTITAAIDGFDITARLEHDDTPDRPDERQDGFWPSLDPNDAGYIGPRSKSTLARHMAKAKEVMAAWERDEWTYVGVVLSVERNGVTLARHAASLWGIEMNYPGGDNSYLTEVANELLDEALDEARNTLERLCDCEHA